MVGPMQIATLIGVVGSWTLLSALAGWLFRDAAQHSMGRVNREADGETQ